MAHPRIEEVEDSELEVSDPSDGDIDTLDASDVLLRRRVPDGPGGGPLALRPRGTPGADFEAAMAAAAAAAGGGGGGGGGGSPAAHAGFQCLYPVYFDATRTRAAGRRVSTRAAVRNPLAREIATACAALRLAVVLEPGKTHPQDWANPGRVRVGLRRGPAGAPRQKRHLLALVAAHLRAHPTTDQSPALRLHIPGAPPPPDPDAPWPRPAVPRGAPIGDLLPYVSPALSGGGVSENLLRDAMREMQTGRASDPVAAMMSAAAGGGQLGPTAAEAGKKKEKKEKKEKKGKGRG